MSIGLALLIINDARNLTRRFLEFFEYVGNVANGVETIVQAHEIVDATGASPLKLPKAGLNSVMCVLVMSLINPCSTAECSH